MSDSKERADFEAECLKRGLTDWHLLRDFTTGDYGHEMTRGAWLGWQARAQQQAASVPDGWQLVPQEATDEMIEAAGLCEPTGSVRAAWRDMLAAARNPPLPRDRFAADDYAKPRIGAGWPAVPDGLVERLKSQSAAHRYMAEADSADLLDEAIAALAAPLVGDKNG